MWRERDHAGKLCIMHLKSARSKQWIWISRENWCNFQSSCKFIFLQETVKFLRNNKEGMCYTQTKDTLCFIEVTLIWDFLKIKMQYVRVVEAKLFFATYSTSFSCFSMTQLNTFLRNQVFCPHLVNCLASLSRSF